MLSGGHQARAMYGKNSGKTLENLREKPWKTP